MPIISRGLWLATAFLSLAATSIVLNSATVGLAATVDQRLKAVENKTKDYSIKRIRRTKSWINPHLTSENPKPGVLPSYSSQALFQDVLIADVTPISTTVWVSFTLNYAATEAGEMQFAVNTLIGGTITQSLCGPTFVLEQTAGATLSHEFVCQGVINRQVGERLRIYIYLRNDTGTTTVSSLTTDVRLVNQVLVKPAF